MIKLFLNLPSSKSAWDYYILEHWIIISPICFVAGIAMVLFTYRTPTSQDYFNSDFRGFSAGLGFILASLVLVVDGNHLKNRTHLIGEILMMIAIMFYLISKNLLRKNKLKNTESSINLSSLLFGLLGLLFFFNIGFSKTSTTQPPTPSQTKVLNAIREFENDSPELLYQILADSLEKQSQHK